ncbi:MAG: AbrB/MazE/SpoVT family DNA-binding domain-containing protein [Nitrososphaeraceae archaeon]
MTEDEVLAFGEVVVRKARGKDNPPVRVTIPSDVVNAYKLKIGEKIDVITNGKKIVIKRRDVKL